jgi:hypothetical protein
MILRGALACVLLWFLIYTPETPWLRILVGTVTGLLTAWIGSATYEGALGFVDIMTLVPPVIAVFVALLDSKPADEPFGLFMAVRQLRDWGAHKVKVLSICGLQLSWLLFTDIRFTLDKDRPPAVVKVRLV